jgi:hypothetical protein
MLSAKAGMIASEPSRKAVLIAIGGLVVVPAACLIAVIISDDSEPATRPAPETVSVAQTTAPPTGQVLPARAPMTRRAYVAPGSTVQPQRAASVGEGVVEKLSMARRVENSDPKRSRELLRDVLQADPNNEQALAQLATKVLLDENHEEARELARRCVELNSSNPACERVAKLSPAMTPQLEQMALVVEQCVMADPSNADCAYGKMQWFLANGKVDEAGQVAEHLSELNPSAPLSLMAQGRMKAAAGDYGEARRLLQSACDHGSADACTRNEILRNEGW